MIEIFFIMSCFLAKNVLIEYSSTVKKIYQSVVLNAIWIPILYLMSTSFINDALITLWRLRYREGVIWLYVYTPFSHRLPWSNWVNHYPWKVIF